MENKKKILVIDDELRFGEMLKINLETMGPYDVRVEDVALNGLKAAHEFKPDIIFLDVIMRDMGGTDLAKLISAESDLNKIPIVFLTALPEDKVRALGLGEGKYFFLQKPITTEKLIQCIENNLSG